MTHVARLQKIAFGPETTRGTPEAPAFWMPKAKGLLTPKFETKYDEGAYGTIDKNREAYVTKRWAELEISDTQPRDVWIGYILKLLFGKAHSCVKFPVPGSITGTFVEGEVVTESTSNATGTLRRLDDGGSSKALYIEPLTGTFTGGQTLTGGTSGATATGGTILSPSAGRHHVFRLLNSNNHPSATVYGQDPVSGDERAAFCMLDTIDFELMVSDPVKFAMKLIGQPMETTSAQTPVYTTENTFLGRHLAFQMASAFTGLDAASETALERIKLSFAKGVEVIQQSGSASDPLAPTSLHNTEFEPKGDFGGVFDATTIRDYALAGTPQALRVKAENTGATALGTGVYPALQFDYPEVYFNDWNKDSDNAKIVRQNVGFTPVRNNTRGLSVEALLVCSRVLSF